MTEQPDLAPPPLGVQVILTAEAEVIRGGNPVSEPADQAEPDDEEPQR